MQSAASQTSTATSENIAKAAAELNLTLNQMKALTDAVTNTYTASNNRQQAALEPLLNKLQSALNSLQTAASRQNQIESTASSALSQLTNAASQLAQGNVRLSSAVETQLAPGAVSLATGSAALNSGINRLDAGAKKLNAGLETLSASGQTLISGNQQLSAGAQKLLAGGQKLSTADNQLTDSITTLSKGNQQLSTSLSNGTKKLPKLHFTSATAHMIASPTKVTDHNRDSVSNNGTAMMPYMAGVALYVNGMVLNMLLDTVTPRRKPKRVVDWWASKAVMINGTAIAAATVELLTLITLAGLRPTNIFATWITLSLANLAMTNMITWLNLSIGRLGSLVAMVWA